MNAIERKLFYLVKDKFIEAQKITSNGRYKRGEGLLTIWEIKIKFSNNEIKSFSLGSEYDMGDYPEDLYEEIPINSIPEVVSYFYFSKILTYISESYDIPHINLIMKHYNAFISGISGKKRRIDQLNRDIHSMESHLEEYILFWGAIKEFETDVNSKGSAIIEILNTDGEREIITTNYSNTCIKNQPKYGARTFKDYSLIHSENLHTMNSYFFLKKLKKND